MQGSNSSGLALGACLGMKNIGKPCAGKPHARFDEGGQARACSLLYIDQGSSKDDPWQVGRINAEELTVTRPTGART